MKFSVLLVPALWAISGCGSGAASEGETFAEMEAVYERFTRGYRLGEPDSIVALYTDEPLYLPPLGPVLQGRDVLWSQFEFLESIRARGAVAHISFESLGRGASADMAWDVGYYTLQTEEQDGTRSPPGRGKFTTIWRRDSHDNWRIHVDGFSQAPPPPGAVQSTREP
ncbi:MAG: nuclear transport factor 2 family protein [Gemmatimonadota bacterium]